MYIQIVNIYIILYVYIKSTTYYPHLWVFAQIYDENVVFRMQDW